MDSGRASEDQRERVWVIGAAGASVGTHRVEKEVALMAATWVAGAVGLELGRADLC